ncbi:MAG: hypothetical protein NTX15_02230 [Candidatus Kapabacteria bacterium]|nr:hypothetical protein [Candidatus Kapabacteria bacterium]
MLLRGDGVETETAPAVLSTADADATVPVDFKDFEFVTFLLAADFDRAFLAFAELFFDVVVFAEAFTAVEVFFVEVFTGLLALLGSTLTWLFFLLRPS